MNNYKKLYTVSGMTCDGCVQTIGNKLNLESEISEVNIDLNSSEMSITADKEFSINELNKIIENVGDYKINEYKNKNIFVKILSLFNTYKPILVSLSMVIILSLITTNNDNFSITNFCRYFMGYFFIIFSFLKLLNVKQFAISFSNYDPISNKFFTYGLIYPFLELTLGVLFLSNFLTLYINFITIFIFVPQTLGIMNKLSKNEILECACVGSTFNVPISKLTITENLVMIFMAIVMILYSI